MLKFYKLSRVLYRSLVVQVVKHLPAMQENTVWFLGLKDPLEKGRMPTLVFFGFSDGSVGPRLRIHLQCRRPGFDPWVRKIPWRRAWQPTPEFLPTESPWTEDPVGLQLMRSQRDKTEHTHSTESCISGNRCMGLGSTSSQISGGNKIWAMLFLWLIVILKSSPLPLVFPSRINLDVRVILRILLELPQRLKARYHSGISKFLLWLIYSHGPIRLVISLIFLCNRKF